MKHLLKRLHRQTMHRKLLVAILVTCCVTMLVAGVALFAYLTFAMRDAFKQEQAALAKVIAANCVASVTFDDQEAAMEVMRSLGIQKHLVGAAVDLPNGMRFTTIGEVGTSEPLGQAAAGAIWLTYFRLMQTSPIVANNGDTIGTFHLVSNFGPIYVHVLKTFLWVFGLTFVGAVILGFVVTARARSAISDPIRSLANSVKDISEKQDYSVRASKGADGEVGELADAFNFMMERMEASAKLAKETAERHRVEEALRTSEESFRSLFENATIGLYRSSQEGDFLMANPALLAMLGYATFEELVQGYASMRVGVLPSDREHFRECLERIGMVEETEVQWRRRDGKIITVRESAKAIRDKAGTILYFEGCVEDITARKEAAAELQRLNSELVEASRMAGMAEVATGVLHNVGNVLNSVSVSAQLLREQLGRSKFASLQQGVALMDEHAGQLGSFLTEDSKGKLLPGFLAKVTHHMAGEHERWHAELRQLQSNIEHMKEIVAMQQSYARVSNVSEPLVAAELIEDALRMNHASLERHLVQVERDYQDAPPVMVDKHKVLQILVNLIGNAKHALDECPSPEKLLRLKIYKNGSGRVKILVQDNGVGISKENLTRIFQHGFTTRRDGHGFGLHSGAIAAKELGGDLMVHSDGPGLGATFTLELPVAGSKN